MSRDKSHERALQDIAEQATNEEAVPEIAFAAFVYSERTEFTHSTDGAASLRAIVDGLSTHVAAISESTGHSVEEVLSVTLEAAREKREEGHGEWTGGEEFES